MAYTVNSGSYRICKRVFDLFVTLPALAFIAPMLVYAWFLQRLNVPVVTRTIFVGTGQRQYLSLDSESTTLRRAVRYWDVLCGRASVVGPRIRPLAQLNDEDLSIRGVVPPGLVCLHTLRWRTNVAFSPEVVSDREYAKKASLLTDIFIFTRALIVSFYGRPALSTERSIEVLGTHIDNLTIPETLNLIESALCEETHPLQIAFVNADCLNKTIGNDVYRDALANTSLVLADGIGIRIAGSLLSRPIRQNVNGTDLFPRLCEKLHTRSSRLFLLGSRTAVITRLCAHLRNSYPNIVVCGFHDGYFDDEATVVHQIIDAKPDVLLVAFGAPLQEIFITKNRQRLGTKVCIGVGGLFDFYSGRIPRAPQWLREVGLEWIYRLYQEPRRMWRRYLLGNLIFLLRVLAERCGVSYGHTATEVSQ